MSEEKIKNVSVFFTEKHTIGVKIEMELTDQNFYHFEAAISEHLEAERNKAENQSKESIEKYGSNKVMFNKLVGYMEKLRDELRKINPDKDWNN